MHEIFDAERKTTNKQSINQSSFAHKSYKTHKLYHMVYCPKVMFIIHVF